MPKKKLTKSPHKWPDLTGLTFGKLTVIERQGSNKLGSSLWLCQCQCGQNTVTTTTALKTGHCRSCGCLLKTRKGLSTSPEYQTWKGMIRRCYDHKHKRAACYKKFGISVCLRWRTSPEDFITDVGPRPGPEFSIDRINTYGHYSCGKCQECIDNGWNFNCRWATLETQVRNDRRNVFLTYQGKTLTIADWAEFLGIKHRTLWGRLDSNWSIEEALTTPLIPRSKIRTWRKG